MHKTARRLQSLLLFLVVALSASSGVHGASDVWTTAGPKGALISVLSARDKVIYAASSRGLYKSTDWGNRWDLILAEEGRVTSVAIDPADPAVIFVSMDSFTGKPLFKSTDGGRTWRAITAGLTRFNGGAIYCIQSLAIDPEDSRVMYAGTARPTVGMGGGLILKSVDGGESWHRPWEWETGCVMDLKVDPENPRTIFAVTSHCNWHPSSTLFKSMDGGTTWSVLNNDGLPEGRYEHSPDPLRSIVIHPRNGSTLYVATSEDGVYRSQDAGATWRPINDGLPRLAGISPYPAVEDLTWDQDGALYAGLNPYGLYKSIDGGDHWTALNFGAPVTGVIAGFAARSLLYVAGPRGIYRSADAGDSWDDASDGIVGSWISALATDPTMPGAVYASTYLDWPTPVVWDAGDGRWTPDPPDPGVFRSVDRGRTWSRTSLQAGNTYDSAFALAVNTRTGSTYAIVSGALFKSVDHGITWRTLNKPFYGRTIAIDSERSILYVGSDGVQKSEDDARSWSPINKGLMVNGVQSVSCLAIDPIDTRVIFAATFDKGIYKTVDAGGTWTKVNRGLTSGDGPYVSDLSIRRVVIDPSHPQTIYAGASNTGALATDGVFKSDDGGMTWRSASDGLGTGPSRMVLDLVVDPRDHRVYAATYGGIFQSQGEPMSWRPMREGISDLPALHVALDPHPPGAIYAGTSAGVFALGLLP